jgi:hypothetical protein
MNSTKTSAVRLFIEASTAYLTAFFTGQSRQGRKPLRIQPEWTAALLIRDIHAFRKPKDTCGGK